MSWPAPTSGPAAAEARVFLGHDGAGKRCWSAPEDSVGVVGPPRYGKTSGLIIPTVLTWPGPLVSTSTRGDIAGATWRQRQAVAASRGGQIHVYDPFGSEPGYRSMRWSPLAGCAEPAVCFRRVATITSVGSSGVDDASHWRSGAALVLRAYFHAAALEDLPLSVVRRWLSRQEIAEPVAILRGSATGGALWADDLSGIALIGDRERGSFFSFARNALEATAEPTALASCAATDLDVDEFLATDSSLFVVGPSHLQQVIAPLMAGLVDSIAQRAAEIAAQQGGRLHRPLLLALDEVANIAPLHSLPSLVSEGGGRGIITLWATQSLAQLRGRYGENEEAAILGATTAKVIFGGLSNGQDLQEISLWCGDVARTDTSVQSGSAPGPTVGFPRTPTGGIAGGSTVGGSRTTGRIFRPVLTVGDIQKQRPGNAWLFYRSDEPLAVQTGPAAQVEYFARLM